MHAVNHACWRYVWMTARINMQIMLVHSYHQTYTWVCVLKVKLDDAMLVYASCYFSSLQSIPNCSCKFLMVHLQTSKARRKREQTTTKSSICHHGKQLVHLLTVNKIQLIAKLVKQKTAKV